MSVDEDMDYGAGEFVLRQALCVRFDHTRESWSNSSPVNLVGYVAPLGDSPTHKSNV
jgi:hypothetical protein